MVDRVGWGGVQEDLWGFRIFGFWSLVWLRVLTLVCWSDRLVTEWWGELQTLWVWIVNFGF